MDKQLKDKAIDFKGKKYVLVADRINYFNEIYPNGCIVTELLSGIESKTIVVKATVYPDVVSSSSRSFAGHAQEVIGDSFINKTSALENAETSAIGRALGFMGIGVIDGIASVDEINKAENRSKVEATKSKDIVTQDAPEYFVIDDIKYKYMSGTKNGKSWEGITNMETGETYWSRGETLVKFNELVGIMQDQKDFDSTVKPL